MTIEPPPAPRRTLSVLVVEDEARWRDLLVEVIPEMGFVARGVGTAEEALDLMASEPHEILIVDLHLPHMTGIEFFAQVRERWPATEAIILTAYGELTVAQQAIRLRVIEFLTKPCRLADIETALKRAEKLVRSTAAATNATRAEEGAAATLDEIERQRILEALSRNHNNKSAAARELGISRRSLYDRLNQMP